MAIIDINVEKAKGEAMDLNHAMALAAPMQIEAGGYELCAGAQVVVVTAGAAQKPGESRLDLNRKNAAIVKQIVPQILAHNPDPILLMVTNPVDVVTYVALRESGLPPSRVIGSGTVLDSARFRYLMADHCGINPRNIHCHIIGEHGDSELALWSRVNIAGVPLKDFCSTCNQPCGEEVWHGIEQSVRESAYHIIERKGSTSYGISLALRHIVGAILRDEHSVLTVSSLTEGAYGIRDVCLSLPRIVGSSGIEAEIAVPMSESEETSLRHSAGVLREHITSLGY